MILFFQVDVTGPNSSENSSVLGKSTVEFMDFLCENVLPSQPVAFLLQY